MCRYLAAAIATAAALFLLTAPGASAMEESGKACVANTSVPNRTLIGFDPRQVFPVPLYELQTRVITRWKVQVAPGIAPLAQQLVAFQQVGEEESRKIGESALETLSAGTNEFPTRIPITGLHPQVGLHGPVETLDCTGESASLSGLVEGEFGAGETRHYKVETGVGTPVTVTVEPDRDGDGYGDLTQDRCPRGASFGSDCPITLNTPHITVKPHAILVEVGPSSAAPIEVFGQVGWRVPPSAAAGAGRSLTVGLSAGGPVTVAGGATATFSLPLPKSVLGRLDRLAPRHALRARLTIRLTDGGDAVTEVPRSIALHGRKHRQRKP